MALITCPECKNNISNQAAACPHCGYPINNNSNHLNKSHNTHHIKYEKTGLGFENGFNKGMEELGEIVGRFFKKVLLIAGGVVLIITIFGLLASHK